jgi:polysaccharide biosynthesis protein PelB
MTKNGARAAGCLGGLLLVTSLLAPVIAGATNAMVPPVTIATPFNQELYDLGYTVFVANNNPADAWSVAVMALKHHPKDKEWLKRAAQAAEWSGRPEMSLENWAILAESGDRQAYRRALELARALHDLNLQKRLIRLRLSEGDQKLLKEFIVLAEATGEPDEALKVLEQPGADWEQGFVLSEQTRLYDLTGQPQKSLAKLDRLAAVRPLTAAEALRGASLWYGTGHPQKAWTVLLQASKSIAATETTFWETLSDLGWALDHRQQAVIGSEVLQKTGKSRAADYQRMIDHYRQQDKQRAFHAAKSGWQQFQQPIFLYSLLEIGITRERWPELRILLDELSPTQRKQAGENPYFWNLAAQIYRQTGSPEQSLHASWQAVRSEPANGEVIAGHLWLLLEQGKTAEALQIAETWGTRAWKDPALTDAVGAVYASIGDNKRALVYYRLSYSSHRDDPAWLASYAGLLEQSGKPEAGFLARFMAIKVLRSRHYAEMTTTKWKEFRNLTAQLRLSGKQGDGLDRLFRQIAAGPQDAASKDLVTAWLLATEKHDLGRLWLLKAYLKSSQKPAWAELNLALQENDLPAIEALLASSLARLPYRDAVEAARRAGQTPTAETIAFERFQLNDRDHLLDKQLRDLYESHPSRLRYSLGVSDRSGVGLLEQQLVATLPLDNRVWLKAELANTNFSHLKTGVLGSYVSSKQRGLLGVGYRHADGTATLSAGMADGLYRYPVTLLQGDWRFSSRLTADLALGYGSEAQESVALLIGGMKDEAALGITYRLTARDTIRLRAAAFTFRDQMRRYLGNGSSIDGELGHRVHVAWPDATLRLYSGYHQYRANGTPVEKTLALIPQDLAKNASYFIPASFGQVGAGIAFGQTWKETYARNWKAFGSVDVSWNTISGSGFRYELGGVGPLFGLDALLFSLSQESGSFGSSDISTRLDVMYRYLFN